MTLRQPRLPDLQVDPSRGLAAEAFLLYPQRLHFSRLRAALKSFTMLWLGHGRETEATGTFTDRADCNGHNRDMAGHLDAKSLRSIDSKAFTRV
jgi:hypothetical protein